MAPVQAKAPVLVTLLSYGGTPSLMKPEDREMAEDLIIAAYADARGKADRLMEEKMQAVTAGLPLPPGMKMPF